jgi:hypothetical protein
MAQLEPCPLSFVASLVRLPAEQVSDPLFHGEARQFGVEIFKIRGVSVAQCQVEDPLQGPAKGLSGTLPGPIAFRFR